MQELTSDNLNEIIESNDKVMVQYGATWCGQCRMVKPKFKKLANQTEGVKFLYVDAEEFPNSRKMANVKNLPTFAGFKDGKLVRDTFGTKIEKVKEILDEVTSD